MSYRPLVAATAAAICAGGLLAACTMQDEGGVRSASASGRQCFNARMASGFTPVDDDTVDVRVGNRGYRLELTGYCNDVRWADGVVLRSRTGSFVCGPLDAELVVPSIIGPQRCLVTGMRQLSDAELRLSRQRRR